MQLEYSIETKKGFHGWQARTIIPLDNNGKIINVLTMKRWDKKITTSANVELEKVYTDYKTYETIGKNFNLLQSDKSATKKTINDQHKKALFQIENLIEKENLK